MKIIVPITYEKKFYKIIENKTIFMYILSLYLKIDYKIIEENIIFDESTIIYNDTIVKITLSNYVNLKKINSTKFKYLEINFVKNYNAFFEDMIYVKKFDNVEVHYINLEVILKQIYSKNRIELNNFERLIILLTTTNRDEMKSVINNKYLYFIYKKTLELNNKEIRLEYQKDIKEIVDFDYYKREIINEIKLRLIKYLDIAKVEEVLDL